MLSMMLLMALQTVCPHVSLLKLNYLAMLFTWIHNQFPYLTFSLILAVAYHITATGRKIYRNDTNNFPYAAYHLYCSPGNAHHLEEPFNLCDPYSNPQAQEIMQILPHLEWAVHGYPSKMGEGWIGDGRTWELDVGALSSRLYFYQVSHVLLFTYTFKYLSINQ